MLGGLFMAAGALVYLNDAAPKARDFHAFLIPALALMAVGAVIAFCGAVFIDRRGAR